MAMVVALGAIGVANGLWSKNLTIKGTVVTGDLNADWDTIITNDSGAATVDPCTPALNPSGCAAPRTQGRCEYVSGAGTQVATVKITDAYHSYECTVTGPIRNTGSVPFNIVGVRLLINNGNEAGLDQLGGCTLPANPVVDPQGVASVACTVHVKSTAQSGYTYYFAIEVCVAQWNEDPSTGGAASDFIACKTSPQHEGPNTPTLHAPEPPP